MTEDTKRGERTPTVGTGAGRRRDEVEQERPNRGWPVRDSPDADASGRARDTPGSGRSLRGLGLSLLLVLSMAAVAVPASAASGGNTALADATEWSSSGPNSHGVSDTAEGIKATWDFGSSLPTSRQTWTYEVTAGETRTVSFDWSFSGCHSWASSDAEAYVYADSPDGRTTEKLSDTGGCSFGDSGKRTIEVHDGYTVGIRIEGYHYDSKKSMYGSFTLTEQANVPPQPVASTDGNVRPGEATSFDGAGSTDDTGITSYEWDLDGDGTTDATGETASHTFQHIGRHDVTLTTTDGYGRTATDTVTVGVFVPDTNDDPRARVDGVETVRSGERVTLDGTGSTDPDGEIVTHEWGSHRFNEGVELRNASGPRTTFVAPTVRGPTTLYFDLAVTDDEGATGSARVTVQVRPAKTTTGNTATAGDATDTTSDATTTDGGTTNSTTGDAGSDGEWADTDGNGKLNVGRGAFEERYPNLRYTEWRFLFD